MSALGLGLGLPFARSAGNVLDAIQQVFADTGANGAYYDASAEGAHYIEAGGFTLAGEDDPVGLILDQSETGGNLKASQDATANKVILRSDGLGWFYEFDGVGDTAIIEMPSGGIVDGTLVLATRSGTASYGVTIPEGPYSIASDGRYMPGNELVGFALFDEPLNIEDTLSIESAFAERGARSSYGPELSFNGFWRGRAELTSFPALDVSAGTAFIVAWYGCSGLTSFPALDVSAGTAFSSAWYGCSGLTSFPALDVSAGTSFNSAWQGCYGLTSFPALDVSAGASFNGTWQGCYGLTSFPALDVSTGTSFSGAWRDCSGLTSFPALDVSAGTSFNGAWRDCSSLISFPAGMFDLCAATDYEGAFLSCALNQESVDNILVSINASGTSNGALDVSGGASSPPGAPGLSAKASLESRGWTVTTN